MEGATGYLFDELGVGGLVEKSVFFLRSVLSDWDVVLRLLSLRQDALRL